MIPEFQNIEYKQAWHDDYLKWIYVFTMRRSVCLNRVLEVGEVAYLA